VERTGIDLSVAEGLLVEMAVTGRSAAWHQAWTAVAAMRWQTVEEAIRQMFPNRITADLVVLNFAQVGRRLEADRDAAIRKLRKAARDVAAASAAGIASLETELGKAGRMVFETGNGWHWSQTEDGRNLSLSTGPFGTKLEAILSAASQLPLPEDGPGAAPPAPRR